MHLIFMYSLSTTVTTMHIFIYFFYRKNGQRTSILHLLVTGEQFHKRLIFFEIPADIILTSCKILLAHTSFSWKLKTLHDKFPEQCSSPLIYAVCYTFLFGRHHILYDSKPMHCISMLSKMSCEQN